MDQFAASPHFVATDPSSPDDTKFYRVATNLFYDPSSGEYLDIDGDGSGDIAFNFTQGTVKIPSANQFNQKTDGSTQYTQYSWFRGSPFGYGGDLANEPWEDGDSFDENIFSFVDAHAAAGSSVNSSWTTSSNHQMEDNVYYFANDDKSAVTRIIFDDTTPESAKYNSWTTIPQQQENSNSNPAIDFNYKLYREGANKTLESLAVLGQGVDAASLYKLKLQQAHYSMNMTLKAPM